MSALAHLLNLGPQSAQMLIDAGITTPTALRRRGAVAAYVAVKRKRKDASLNLLYALVGALEGMDWKQVQREQKLSLLMQLEDYVHKHPGPRAQHQDELLALRNIGPAMRKDFDLLGIRSVKQLARQNADALYLRIQRLTDTRHDPCVWDTYAAAIHQARTSEALPWWHFTKVRKQRQAEGDFLKRRRLG